MTTIKRMSHSKHWIAVGGLVLASLSLASLGRWQLERAEVNRAIEQGYVAAADLPVLDRPIAADRVEALRYRRIELTGRYRADVQILLDNRTAKGSAGYEVLTPFETGDGGPFVLVNRGWVPASPDRSVLPDVGIETGAATVRGRIDRLPRAGLKLDAPPPVRDRPVAVLSFPAPSEIAAALDHPVHAFQLLLDAEAPSGYARDWTPPADRDERNIAYAVQWFALAALALTLAVGVAWRARRRRPEPLR
jgi:surfeit locus 1 family protein